MPPASPGAGFTPAALTRRGFLKRTAGTAAFLLAFRMRAAPAWARPPGGAPGHLDADGYAILETFCDCVITPAPGAPTAAEARIALRIDHEIGLQGPLFARDVRDALTVIAYSGLLEGKPGSFANLSPGARETILRGMMRSRLSWRRTSFQGLRQLALFFYYADDRAWASTGYDGPWVARKVAATEARFSFPAMEKKA